MPIPARARHAARVKTLYVDADGCAVKDEVYRVAARYRWPVVLVANHPVHTPASPLISTVVVAQGADVADDYIAERAGPGDIVVTSDLPLAARVLDREARALGPKGREFTVESIGDFLASRALSQQLREMGVMTGGPAPMARNHRSQFLGKLDELINAIQRAYPHG